MPYYYSHWDSRGTKHNFVFQPTNTFYFFCVGPGLQNLFLSDRLNGLEPWLQQLNEITKAWLE